MKLHPNIHIGLKILFVLVAAMKPLLPQNIEYGVEIAVSVVDLFLAQREGYSEKKSLHIPRIMNTEMVPIGGKLPPRFVVRTSQLLDLIIEIYPGSRNLAPEKKAGARKAIGERLGSRTRPGYYAPITEDAHISYCGQPEGRGSQHHWRIHCTDEGANEVRKWINRFVEDDQPQKPNSGEKIYEWNGMIFRSKVERKVAQALAEKGLTFFANANGMLDLRGLAVSDALLAGRIEKDFLVFHHGHALALEIDGPHHDGQSQRTWDCANDRVLLREGIPTIRFDSNDCWKKTDAVIDEILAIIQAGNLA